MYRSQPSQASQPLRCDTVFTKDNTTSIDLQKVINYYNTNTSLFSTSDLDSSVKNNIDLYNKQVKKYNIFDCESLLKDPVRMQKNPNDTNNCKNIEISKKTSLDTALKSLSGNVKENITKKANKLKTNSNDDDIKKLSCYLKLLIDIIGSPECNKYNQTNYNTYITKIVDKHTSTKKSFLYTAKAYIETILYDSLEAKKALISIQEFDKTFADTLIAILTDFQTCTK